MRDHKDKLAMPTFDEKLMNNIEAMDVDATAPTHRRKRVKFSYLIIY